ncbi:MAG: DNA polymerase III subunit delta [Capsulimonadaceae bacterium]|nr:DNA polymerase III subunit delta [Capsulimonadaceae bacterium]
MAEIAYGKSAADKFPGALSRVYLIVGGDDALKREALHRLYAAALDPAFADFDRETIDLGAGGDGNDGGEDPVVKILSAASAAPFMSPRRVVNVLSVQRLAKERQEALANGLARLGELSCLILVASAQEFEAGRPKGKSVENALRKAAAAAGVVVVCDAPEARDLRSRADAVIAGSGKSAPPEVIEILVARASAASGTSGGDVNTLINETQKLIAYVGDASAITVHDARQVIAHVSQENIFQLLDAIGARDPKTAIARVDAMLESGDKAEGVAARTFVMIQRHFRLMALAKYLGDRRDAGRGALPADIQEMLSPELSSFATGQAHRLQNYGRQASRFSWSEINHATQRILLSDLMTKGIAPGDTLGVHAPMTGDDAATNLRVLVLDLCRIGR